MFALSAGFGALAQAPEVVEASPSAPYAMSTTLEGAVGLSLGYQPEVAGGRRGSLSATPSIFLRYGRFTLTNAPGFSTRRSDDVAVGLGFELVREDRLRANLSLRFDEGRKESSRAAYAGLGNVRPTLRMRAAASWRIEGPWRVAAAWDVDSLGRGGGNTLDFSASWDQAVARATALTLGASAGVGSSRYMQTYFGVNEEQSVRSGYRVYHPGAGVRDAGLYAALRRDVTREWIWLAGASASRLLGSAAASPITRHRNGWGLSTGLAWTF